MRVLSRCLVIVVMHGSTSWTPLTNVAIVVVVENGLHRTWCLWCHLGVLVIFARRRWWWWCEFNLFGHAIFAFASLGNKLGQRVVQMIVVDYVVLVVRLLVVGLILIRNWLVLLRRRLCDRREVLLRHLLWRILGVVCWVILWCLVS